MNAPSGKSATTASAVATSVILVDAERTNRGAATSWQLNLFNAADPLIGVEVSLPQHCQCGHDKLHIGPGRGPHRASLHCARCRCHCGWLSNESAKFLSDVIEYFGRPTVPVCVRVPPRVTAERVVTDTEQ
jgi:hypothetical protein